MDDADLRSAIARALAEITPRRSSLSDADLEANLATLGGDVVTAQAAADDAYEEALARRPNISAFTESGTWNKPAGSLIVFVRCLGSGATGETFKMFQPSELGATESVTVATGDDPGEVTTSFGAHASAVGIEGAAGSALIVSL